MSDKHTKRILELVYTPIVTVWVEEFEDGTFDVKNHVDLDMSDSFQYVYDSSTGDETEDLEVLSPAAWDDVNRLLYTLAVKQHYPAWTPEDEPF